MLLELGDAEEARRLLDEALSIHERVGTAWEVADSRFLRAQVSASAGDWASGRDQLEESVRAFAELGDAHYTMLARRTLAWMYDELGDTERYRTLTEENYRQARATGNKRMEARAQAGLADLVVREGDVGKGLAMYQSSLRLDREVGDQQGSRIDLYDIAEALSIGGAVEPAAVILAATEAWRERSGTALESWLQRMNAETLERLHADMSNEAFAQAWQRGQAMSVDDAVELALEAAIPESG
jgi:tetratricopeptide (TPR) repeat protein